MAELQKDLVLSPNEYSYVLDETKGNVACNVGPHKMSLSQSDTLVYFDTKTMKILNDNINLKIKQLMIFISFLGSAKFYIPLYIIILICFIKKKHFIDSFVLGNGHILHGE